jgi:flagellar basal body-associated protein FliL
MADAPKQDAAAPAAKKKAPILVIGLVGLNLAAVTAAGAYLFLTNGAAARAPAHHDDESGEGEHEASDEEDEGDDEGDEEDEDEEEERELGPLVEFESLVVNLADSGAGHYLKITFQLELRSDEVAEHVETHMVPYRDRVLAYLGALSVEAVSGAEGGLALRENLLALAREVFGRRAIRAIYFTELLVQ